MCLCVVATRGRSKGLHIPVYISQMQFAINCGEVPVFDPHEFNATVKPAMRVARFKFSASPPLQNVHMKLTNSGSTCRRRCRALRCRGQPRLIALRPLPLHGGPERGKQGLTMRWKKLNFEKQHYGFILLILSFLIRLSNHSNVTELHNVNQLQTSKCTHAMRSC